MALIEATGITKSYGKGDTATHALRGASFTIDAGEFVALMGPSGSGKSTLLHVIGFLDRQTEGVYKFDGKTIGDLSSDELAHVRNKEMGFVFQQFNLLARATVLDNVKLPLLYSDVPEGEWDEQAMSRIKMVGLEHRVNHYASQLSGGEKQRVAVARALVNNPGVVFADEPTGNLDSKSGQVIMERLQYLNEVEGRTVVLITHETTTAEHADRIVRIEDGKVVSDEKVEHKRAPKDFSK